MIIGTCTTINLPVCHFKHLSVLGVGPSKDGFPWTNSPLGEWVPSFRKSITAASRCKIPTTIFFPFKQLLF